MKTKKFKDYAFDSGSLEKIKVLDLIDKEDVIKDKVLKHFLKLDSCSEDFKTLISTNNVKVEVNVKYAPVYSIKCIVNDDYRVSFLEDGMAFVHIVNKDRETSLVEENIEKTLKEEIVRFEGDYHFCCSEYQGPFASTFVKLDFEKYLLKKDGYDELNIIDRLIGFKSLNSIIYDKVKKAFLDRSLAQAKKFVLSKHNSCEYQNCIQNTKVLDSETTLFLVPIYEIVVNYNETEYISYVSGVDGLSEYDYPRNKDFTNYINNAKLFFNLRNIFIELLILLICGLGIELSHYLKQNIEWFNSLLFILTIVISGVIGLGGSIFYFIKYPRYRDKKDLILAKYENSINKPKSMYMIRMIIFGVLDLLVLIGIIILLII